MTEQTLKEDILKILRLLSLSENLTQRELSAHLGFSLGKTNYLLRSLVQKDLIKLKNFISRDHKLRKIKYILTKDGFEEKLELTYYFLKRKEKEYLELQAEIQNSEKFVKIGGDSVRQ